MMMREYKKSMDWRQGLLLRVRVGIEQDGSYRLNCDLRWRISMIFIMNLLLITLHYYYIIKEISY